MTAQLETGTAHQLLVIDEAYDRTRASDGFSRFGAYLAMRLPAIVDHDPQVLTDRVRWAVFAWGSGTSPVMSPGYAEWTGPIDDIQVAWDEGQLLVEAVVRTDLPVRLTGWRGWERGHRGRLIEPHCSNGIALSQVVFRTRLLDLPLPKPPRDWLSRNDVVTTAKLSVDVIASAVEDLLTPVVAALADSGSHRPTGMSTR